MNDAKKKQALSDLSKNLVERTGLSYERFTDEMNKYMHGEISHGTFVSHFIRTDRHIGNIFKLDEVLAFVRVVATFPDEVKRCKAGEAFEMFGLTGIKPEDYQHLKSYFPEAEYQNAWQEFQQKFKPEEAPKPKFSLPPYPRLFIGREQDLAYLEERFGIQVPASRQQLTIIRGWPGVGKTTLVQHLVNNPKIHRAFHEGVLWSTAGNKSRILDILRKWGRELGLYHVQNMDTIDEITDGLRQFLWGKNILIVVDDLWQYEDGYRILQLATPHTTFLLTTRFTDLAVSWTETPHHDVYKLPVLSDEKSLELLARLAPLAVQTYPFDIKELAKTLEGLPLALRVAGGLLQRESTLHLSRIPGLIKELRENFAAYEDRTVEQRMNEQTGITPTIKLLFERSLETLSEDEQTAFAALGIFAPKPATFDLNAIAKIWEVEDPLPYIRTLVGRGLLEPIENKEGRFQMHYTLAMYAKSLLQ